MKNRFIPSAQMLQIAVPGDLLATNAGQFAADARASIEAPDVLIGWLGVEVDLTRARMIDSAGVGAIVSLTRELLAAGRKTVIRVGDPNVHRVCLFTRLDRI